ncbi:MAG TPA: amino acid adenylation domain-containing protein [Thermoanaerobaculia bacterium]|nr:amino acid adenylation domain-containing protein [Thermoanaerobaculia bacterium]
MLPRDKPYGLCLQDVSPAPLPPQAASFPELFAAAARAFPESPAVIGSEGESWSYRRLDEASNRLARRLRDLGVGLEDAVGVCMERSPELILGLVAILKAGGVYVPLNPALPDERLLFQIEDTGARVVLVHAGTRERLPEHRRLEVDPAACETGTDGDGASLGVRVPAESLCYVIYTSGSTGVPKGVGVPHGAAMLHSAVIAEDDKLGPGERVVQFASLSFDVSLEQMLPPLISGAAVVLRGEDLTDPGNLLSGFARLGITSANLPTAYWHQAVRGWSAEAGPLPLRLRVQCVGGEAMLPEAARRWVALAGPLGLGGVRLINGYGPTETVVTATRYTVPDSLPPGASSVPIGRLLPLRSGTVIDQHGDPQPAGVPGELCLGGILARGYVNRPDLTAERFVPDPFSGEPGARMYRTGDLVRSLPGGDLDYLGRLDRQVKVRGFRIEPGEIEAVLSSHPEVRDCAVVARQDSPGETHLVAYVASSNGAADLTVAAVREFLRAKLPDYMVPGATVFLDALPLTPNGKVDRKALPRPDRTLVPGDDFVPPHDEVELRLALIWEEILDVRPIGVHDNFFVLGGHSLLATQVATRIRGAFGVDLSLRTLFEAPTTAELARIVREARPEGAAEPPILPVPRDVAGGELLLSFAQQRLWFLDQLEPGSPAYNIPFAVRLTGDVAPPLLARIFAEVVRRHEALRTTFLSRDGRPVQVIAPQAAVELPVVDLSGLRDRTDQARQLATEEAERPFDLERGPLLRLVLVRLAERDWLLLMTMHHIVSDGWSMGVLLREIAVLYEAFSQRRPSPLPELPVQYADFAHWQREWLQGDVLERQLAFWKTRLAGAPAVLELPTDRPRPPIQTLRGASRRIALSATLSREIRELCRRQGVTPFMALLAAWAVLLGRHAGQEDVLIGSPIAGRNRREIEDLIGFFANTLVLRSDLSGNPGFSEHLSQVRSAALDAYAHQDLPFERIVEEMVAERDLSHFPLFQALFVLQNAPAGTFRLPGLVLAPVEVESRVAKLDLALSLTETPDGIAGFLEHNTDLFDGSTAEHLLARFEALLAAAASQPGLPIADLPLVLPAERHQLLEWSATGAASGAGLCLHELFAAQAAKTPRDIALRDANERLTYAELAGRAGALAHFLRKLGVRPGGRETRVAVCLERSPDLIAALLGVLAAGAVYVPIDPAYPVERRTLMLEDSGAAVLVTRGRRAAAHAASHGLRVLDLDTEQIAAAERLPRDAGVTPGNLAYVIYTSGSTGRPKGVAIEHRSAAALVGWAREELSAEELSGVLASTSVCFDLSVFEIFVPLALGGRVLLAENALALPALPFASEVRLLNTVPSAAAELVHMGGLPAGVRTVCLAGEPLPAVLAEGLYATGTVQRVLNLYGPSEDTTYSTRALIPRSLEGRVPAIGRPLPGTRVSVVDRNGAPVPPGVAGELWLAGAGLARGYLGRPELTAERFTPDPSGGAGERVYRTGDLVRFRPDGELEFLGRIDHQVKVRGFRIELGEIEAVLGSHPAVEECVVAARESVLVAYVVLDRTDPIPFLAAWLRERLPAYMAPSVFMVLEALPRTPNGKVDRRALPAPDHTLVPAESFAPPRDEVELRLARIWEDLLDVRPIGVHDNFFALGGHSLLSTRVATRIRGAFGVELPLRTLFKAPTISELASAVREAEGAVEPPIVPVPRDAAGGELPLSFGQQRLWFLHQLEPASPAYNMPLAVRLTGALSPALLARVFAEVVRRHEALRTTFASRDGRPVQVIAPQGMVELPVVDLSGLRDRSDQAREIALAEALRPFDLERGPLLRLGLVRLAERDWLLLVTMHHIVSDGWSMGVLQREIAALYEAFSQGRPSPLPELPVQYADFAHWQREWLQGDVLEGQLAFWRDRLAGAPAVLELPADRPRPPIQTFRGASRPISLAPALSQEIRELCQRQGVTPFMALLAAWAVLLGRHAGQDDVLTGSPIAGRNRREIEDLIGFFVNTLVLRSDLSANPSFSGFLDQMRSAALDAYAHQDLPFERLVEELVAERDLAYSPLFQVLFVLQNAPAGAFQLPGLVLAPVEVESRAAKLDLSLSLTETPDGISGFLEHDTDLFDGSTAERLLARFEVLLAAAAAEPGRPVADLPLLSLGERQQVLVEWNGMPGIQPQAASFPELFAAAARAFPEAPAVIGAEGEAWSYRRLDEASNRLARRLRALGVGLEDAVGVCMERSPELILGVVAVLKAGGVYVPLNPAHPDERLLFQVEDTGARVVLVHAGTRERLPGHSRLEVDSASCETGDASPLGVRVPAEGLCYVIYTSGSTGTPKGVGVPHGAAMLHSRVIAEDDGLGPGERVIQFASLSFDVSLEQMLPTLISGAAVVLRGEDLADPGNLLSGFARLGVTSANLPTAYWHQAVQGWSTDTTPEPLRLRVQCVGGEAMLPEAARRWVVLAGPLGLRGVRLINGYGPTETVVTATRYTVPDSIAPEASSVPIGHLLPLRSGMVVDPRGDLQPVGVPGELCLGGILARGYVNRPDLTAERFVPDPFSGEPGTRMYRTGDLVRRLPDGNLDYAGRIDRQVKVRGFRIEPGEIEAVLSAHPGVRDCAVVARRDTPGETQLVAYVVSSADLTAAAVRDLLREKLPDYMVPGATVFLDALPLTPNGKVDRKALPRPDRSLAPGEGFVPPRDEIELRLARIWEELLDVRPIGVHDNFFVLGGHSLLATQVATRIRAAFEVELLLRTLFEAPTLAGLARIVREARPESVVESPIVPVPRDVPGGELPLSFAQQRLWVIEQIDPGSPAYSIPFAMRLTGELSPALLARAFAEVVRRHEALRTTFASREGRPVQVISPQAAVELPVVDLSGLPDRPDRSDLARQLARVEALRPFDLERGPLLRLGLVRLAGRDWLLLLTMHHIVSDGWSVGVLLREVGTLYAAFAQGLPSPLPELPVQYADFAVWQRGWLQGGVLERQLAYWTRELAGAPHVLELPTDRPRPPRKTFRGASRPVALAPALSNAVRKLCLDEGVTPFMALLAAWSALLGRHAGQDDLLVGSPIAGRNRREVEDLIGFFVNTLVLRSELEPTPGAGAFRLLLARTRRAALDAFEHQDLPFERLVEELAPERDLARTPLFQVLFVMQNAPDQSLAIPGLAVAPFTQGSQIAKFDLALSFWEEADGFAGELEHDTDLFDGSTAERLLARFEVLLAAASSEPGRPVADLPLLSSEERQQVLVEWNDTPGVPPQAASFPELFAAVASAFPEAPAVIDAAGEAWSYRRLDEASNRLARRLRALGVGVDEAVGLCMERSPELILGVVSVFKAGGVYVPLNPAHPDERLLFQIEDTGATVVLVHAGTRERLPGHRRLEVDPAACETGDGSPLGVRVPAESLCYVIYTSGSTGTPKGVGIPHGAATLHSRVIAEDDGLRPGERVIQFASLSFDVSLEQMLPTLISGAAVVLRGEDLADPAEMLPGFARLGITSANLPTAYWHQAVQGWSAQTGPLPLRLRVQCVGGEAMLPEAARRWVSLARPLGLDGVRLINGYGPTETVVTATRYTVDSVPPGASSVPIGRLLAFRTGTLLDRGGALQPVGVPGELCLSGILARGYVNRPELTAERFVPDPFSEEPGARMYRTGDLVRALPDGNLDYLGRIDRQVKVRGFRIEPGEIEAVLSAHLEVRDCAVVARRDTPGETRLVAYVVPSEGADLTAAAVRELLRAKLPDYMVPAVTVFLDALPLTPNGKVDRKALPAPDRGGTDTEGSAAPSDPVEELLAGIWARVLGLDRAGIHDDFFALGGHSLLATQVVSRIRSVLGVELPVRKLFEFRTIAGLARAVEATRQEGGEQAPPITRRPADGPPPPSFAQQRLWLIDQLDPGSPLYNIPWAVRLTGPVAPELLAQVFAEVVRRHEALRTTFASHDGKPVQVIAPPAAVELPVVDLSGLPDRTDQARQLAREEALRPFDLERGPLLRLGLVRLAERDWLLLLTMHHIVADGWSLGVLLREVGILSAAFSQGHPSPLPDLPVQYADFAVWQRAWLQGEVLERQLAWWKRDLAGAPQVLDLPTDRPRPPLQTFHGAVRPATLPPALSEAVRWLCLETGTTPFMALLAAWSVLLGRHAGQDDVLVGSPIAGRNRREVEDLIGFFVNTLVLRSAWDEATTFRQLLARVRSTALDAYAHQDLPFERLVEEIVPERDLSRTPLVQVLFVMQNAPVQDLAIPGLAVAPFLLDGEIAKLDLALSFWQEADGFAGELEHNTDLFDRATAERLLERFQTLLAAAAADPEQPVVDLPFLTPEERRQLQAGGQLELLRPIEDRSKALPAPERPGPARGEGAAPSDPIEEILAGIWAGLLGLDRVGVDENFFTLGGHSLLAAQVVSRIRAALGIELPLRKLFEFSTVATLARAVKAARQESVAQAPPRIVPLSRESGLPLAFTQQRIWFLEQLDPGAAVFNMPAFYILSGPLDVAVFRQAIAEIRRRHEALRTTIAGPEASPFQLVHPPSVPELPVVDLSALPAGHREREAERAAGSAARLPFRFDRGGSLTRFLLLRPAADDHRFLTVFHHLVSDGVSQAIFERELLALYEAFSAGRPSPLTDLPVQYGDYAAWQRQVLAGDHLAAQLAFWRERLAGPMAVLRLPTDRQRPEVPSTRGAFRELVFPAELSAALRELSRREGSTLYITLLAAFVALLHRATGQRDLPLGTPVSFRDRPEVEGLIGMFVNTLVIRSQVTPEASFRAHLAHVRERVLEAFGHQDVPFERLVEELQPERGPHDTPFFQLMFALFARPEAALRAGGLELRPLGLENGTAQFELTLYMIESGDELAAEVGYRTELFDPETIDRMLGAYRTLLEAAVANPDVSLSELPFEAWLVAAAQPAVPMEPPPPRLSAVKAVAARAAQVEERRSQLTDEQRERLRQKLRRK